MNPRQRFIETMTFGRPDRPPFLEFSLRPATLDNWRRQGLPPDVDVQAFFGFDPTISVPVTTGPLPRFEVKILHQDDRYKIWIDELGALRKDFVHDREPGFVTRTWLKFPVQSRRDFLQIKHRFDPDHPDRLPPDFARWAQQARNRTCPLRLTLHSMFWELRDWMGFHGLCTAFYDAPDLVHQMMQFQTDFNIALCSRIFQHVMPDWVFLQEDMAYKTASMISPQMVRQFMLPHYRRLASFLRDAGVPVVMLDSDGHVSELIPIWLEAGINAANPFEV
ncbi:MAG: uroporphyrinogen decarboxylase family protein, partial [Phycisphaerae bacterium]